ncbi:high-affnity carbon uptake protein Hat/HatR [alpha proteobacterium U9-1i]|nr:high-affnity carbon uptake protein Hat/HatR [alpha proteobacterium U9-1i]
MADIFVSYKKDDKARVEPLVRALESQGFTVWWDYEIETGGDWLQQILKEIDVARAVIGVWSQQSVTADGCFAVSRGSTISYVDREHARAQTKLAPVLLDRVRTPFEYEKIQAADLTDWGGDANHPGFRQVVARIEQLALPLWVERKLLAANAAADTERRRREAAEANAAARESEIERLTRGQVDLSIAQARVRALEEQLAGAGMQPKGDRVIARDGMATIVMPAMTAARSEGKRTIAAVKLARTLEGHLGHVTTLAWAPDGKRLASGSRDETVAIWDVAAGRRVESLSIEGASASVQFDPRGAWLAVGPAPARWGVSLVNLRDSKIVRSLPFGEFCFAGSGSIWATEYKNGYNLNEYPHGKLSELGAKAVVAAPKKGLFGSKPERPRHDSSKSVNTILTGHAPEHLAFTNKHDVLAVGLGAAGVTFFNLSNCSSIGAITQIEAGSRGNVGTHASGTFATSQATPEVTVLGARGGNRGMTEAFRYNVTSQRLIGELRTEQYDSVASVAYSPTGAEIALGFARIGVTIFDAASSKPICELPDHNGAVFAVNFSPDGSLLATACEDGAVRLWELVYA